MIYKYRSIEYICLYIYVIYLYIAVNFNIFNKSFYIPLDLSLYVYIYIYSPYIPVLASAMPGPWNSIGRFIINVFAFLHHIYIERERL